LAPILPDAVNGWRIELGNADESTLVVNNYGKGYITFRLATFNMYETVTVWHTTIKRDFGDKNPADRYTLFPAEYLGQDQWGYAYLCTRFPQTAKPFWPIAKQDIIKALQIKTE